MAVDYDVTTRDKVELRPVRSLYQKFAVEDFGDDKELPYISDPLG